MKKKNVIALIAAVVFLLSLAAIPLVGYVYAHGMIQSKLLDRILLADKSRREMREAKAHNRQRTLKIGIAGPLDIMKDDTLFLEGVELAINETNAAGGVLGMKVEALVEDDGGSLTESLRIAQKFAVDIEVFAVIGHWTAANTLPIAAFYNGTGVLMLAPTVTNSELTQDGYDLIFRNTVDDVAIGKKMAEYAENRAYKNIAIYYANPMDGKGLTLAFEAEAKKKGIRIIDRHSTFITREEFTSTFREWKIKDVDAVFIADTMRQSRDLVSWIRDESPDLPLFAGSGFNYENLADMYGSGAEGIAFASFPLPWETGKTAGRFETVFRDAYGILPDYYALKGYESVETLKNALEAAGTTSPSRLVSAMKSAAGSGEQDGTVIVKKIVDGTYMTVSK